VVILRVVGSSGLVKGDSTMRRTRPPPDTIRNPVIGAALPAPRPVVCRPVGSLQAGVLPSVDCRRLVRDVISSNHVLVGR